MPEGQIRRAVSTGRGPVTSTEPVLERYGQDWICRRGVGGAIIPNYEGVAYAIETGRYVHTEKRGTSRGFRELGAKTRLAALEEEKELKKQMSLVL